MNLSEFYKLYESVINYSIVTIHANEKKNHPINYYGEKKNSREDGTGKFSNKEDENLCEICFEKQVEVVLPCSVSLLDDWKFVKEKFYSMAFVMDVVQCGM